jgi:hypothetical protein
MRAPHYIIAVLVLMSAGFMMFDGLRAFIVGDYVTPRSGPHAGQLGLWSKLAQSAGIEPRSSLMKGIHVVQGAVTLALLVCFLLKLPWAPRALLVAAIAGLWYLPFGTVANIIVIALLLLTQRGAVVEGDKAAALISPPRRHVQHPEYAARSRQIFGDRLLTPEDREEIRKPNRGDR